MSAQPTQVWAAIDMKQDNTRHCPECNESIKSLLTMECPNCNAALPVPGTAVEDGEKEKEKFNQMVQAAEAEDKAAAAVEPESVPEPVAATPTPEPEPIPEPVAPTPIPEPVAPPTPVSKAPELPPIPERPVSEPAVSLPNPPPASAPKATPPEGLISKILRLFGLKK